MKRVVLNRNGQISPHGRETVTFQRVPKRPAKVEGK